MKFIKQALRNFKGYKPPLNDRIDSIRLDFNENTDENPLLRDISLFSLNLSIYPSYDTAYSVLSKYLNVSADKLLLTNGIDDALRLIIDSVVEIGDKVVIPSPTYTMYKFYCELNQANIIEVEFNDEIPQIELDTILKDNIKILFICSPNNPTGQVFNRNSIEYLLKRNPGTLFILDEAYVEFTNNTLIDFAEKYDNVLVLRTFSKAYGMAGIRLGYIIGNEFLISFLRNISSPYSVNSVAIYAMQLVLKKRASIDQFVKLIKKNRGLLTKYLQNRGFEVFPSEANFILVNFNILNNYIVRGLSGKNILIRDRSSYRKGCSRITIGSIEQIDLLIASIDELLDKETIIFDMDGVIIDVNKSHRLAIKKTVKQITGKETTDEEINRLKQISGFNNDWKLTQELVKSHIYLSFRTKKLNNFILSGINIS